MTSEKQVQANRRNALKSTGPRTPEGKEAVRQNARTHGLLSREILLPGEDEDALEELGEGLRADLQPVGQLENRLVDRIISSYWRLQRVGRVESGIFAWERSEELAQRAEREADRWGEVDISEGPFGLSLTIVDHVIEMRDKALYKASQMRCVQEGETATLGRIFARDAQGNVFSKLSRYETAIERTLHRSLHELERRQAARRGAAVTPPQVLDVEVSGIPEETGS